MLKYSKIPVCVHWTIGDHVTYCLNILLHCAFIHTKCLIQACGWIKRSWETKKVMQDRSNPDMAFQMTLQKNFFFSQEYVTSMYMYILLKVREFKQCLQFVQARQVKSWHGFPKSFSWAFGLRLAQQLKLRGEEQVSFF